MQPERHVRLFRNGRNQVVLILRDFEMDGNEAIIRKDGNRLILEPVSAKNRLVDLLKTLEPLQVPVGSGTHQGIGEKFGLTYST